MSQGLFSLTEFQLEERRKAVVKKKDLNPFEIHGCKEMWDKIVDLHKNNQPIKFPDIGIEKTPFYQLELEKGKQTKTKNQDLQTRIMKGEFIYRGKTNRLDLKSMFKEIDRIKAYKPRIEKIDPEHKNLLSHKLAKAMEQADILWGVSKKIEKQPSVHSLFDSFEHSMENLFDQSTHQKQLQRKALSQERISRKYVYTKQHTKIRLK